MDKIEIVEANMIIFIDRIEKAINEGYKVDYDVYPRFTGALYICNVYKEVEKEETTKPAGRKAKSV